MMKPKEVTMTIAANDAATARGTGSAQSLARHLHADSATGHLNDYFLEEARRALSGGVVFHHKDHHTLPDEFQSSACFDAWAKDDDEQIRPESR
jgi:hypothetical protein